MFAVIQYANVLGTAVTAAWLLKVFCQGWQVCVIYLQAKTTHESQANE